MAANGLACFLIALAGHGGGKAPTSPAAPVPLARNDVPPRSAAVQTTKFLEAVPAPVPVDLCVDRAIVAKSRSIRGVEIYAAYKDWCSQTNSLAIDEAGFVQEFAALAIDRNMESSNPQDPRTQGNGFEKTMKAASDGQTTRRLRLGGNALTDARSGEDKVESSRVECSHVDEQRSEATA
jgi:hypothetical protein